MRQEKRKPNSNSSSGISSQKSNKKSTIVDSDLFKKTEFFFHKNNKILFIVLILISAIFSFLLFDVKISEGNDDSLYIEGGFNYAHDFYKYHFTANAPLYPIILGAFISLFGFNLIALKLLNVAFYILGLVLFYKAFEKKIPFLIFYPVSLIIATNSYFLYFASQTYTESLFIFLQYLFIYFFVKHIDNLNSTSFSFKNIKNWLSLGVLLFLLTYCKNIAIGGVIAVFLFFLYEKKYLNALISVVSFLLIKIPFEFFKDLIWNTAGQYSSQTQILLQKDPYDPTKGYEDLAGFVTRFLQNFDIYISKRFFQILSFRSDDESTTKTGLSILFLLVTVWIVYVIFKSKDKLQIFILAYTLILTSLTFIVLQTRWDQPRFVLVYVPLILILFFNALFVFSKKHGTLGFVFYFTIIAIFIFSSFIHTTKKSVSQYPILKKNLKGDIYYGYTPDWVNYLKLSAWCGDSLPKNSLVACRKAPMSFVYSKGMKFYPVYTVLALDSTTNLSNPDSLLMIFKKDSVTHVLLANLRRNPKKVDGYVINTIQRMMEPVARKYPEKLTLVKQIGDSEPAYLYKINY